MYGKLLWNSSQRKLLAAFLILFLPLRLVEHEFTQFQSRLVQLRFTVADGAIEQGRDFVVVEPFDIMKHKDESVTGRQVIDSPLQC